MSTAHYATQKQREFVAAARQSFAKLAPKVANRPVHFDMANFDDSDGTCVQGTCRVKMADSSYKRLDSLKKGDRAWDPVSEREVPLVCLVANACKGERQLVVLGDLVLTPWHPVAMATKQNGWKWRFPATLKNERTTSKETALFSFVLGDGGVALEIEQIPCIALGHGLNHLVARHSYLGSPEVLADLARLPGFESGFVTVGSPHRDLSGEICGLSCEL